MAFPDQCMERTGDAGNRPIGMEKAISSQSLSATSTCQQLDAKTSVLDHFASGSASSVSSMCGMGRASTRVAQATAIKTAVSSCLSSFRESLLNSRIHRWTGSLQFSPVLDYGCATAASVLSVSASGLPDTLPLILYPGETRHKANQNISTVIARRRRAVVNRRVFCADLSSAWLLLAQFPLLLGLRFAGNIIVITRQIKQDGTRTQCDYANSPHPFHSTLTSLFLPPVALQKGERDTQLRDSQSGRYRPLGVDGTL
ncbi:hypothetical protein T12_7053 [Trichinella patagoniensis]|uniref:Uncharacterized protein n=1 Tax=Trichinella patagoniensis TaxID=990121 RepID=A0A0V0ZCV0_9BILA|nr:hypothetical protein T12_7053 [Trichinella patagoniensis]